MLLHLSFRCYHYHVIDFSFTEEITGGLQTGLIVLNVISILSGFVLSVSLVKNPKRRDVFSIVALCVSAFFGFLMFGILAFGLIATFM